MNVKITWNNVFWYALLLLIGFMVGAVMVSTLSETTELVTETVVCEAGLTEADFTKITELAWVGGFCERLGLESTIKVEVDEQGTTYGVPVCITPQP